MKRISFLLTILSVLVLSFGLSNAQIGGAVSVSSVDGMYQNDTIMTGVPIMFRLRYNNTAGTGATANAGISNGYRVYSPDGAVWAGPVAGDTLNGAIPSTNFDLGLVLNVFLGTGSDTLGILGLNNNKPGLALGMDVVAYGMKIGSFPDAASGLHVCIDSSWFRPGGTWKWAGKLGYKVFPTWQQKCYTIYKVPNLCPTFTNPPVSVGGSHCNTMTHTFTATDFEQNPVSFSLQAGDVGSITPGGVWSWNGATLADVGTSINIHVTVTDGLCGNGTTITVPVVVTNAGPTINSGCQTNTVISTGECKSVQMTATDDCDPISWSQATVPAFTGTMTISPTGLVTFCPSAADGPNDYTTTVTATDGNLSTSCTITWHVIVGCPYAVAIDTISSNSGVYTAVNVILKRQAFGMGGFDFLVAYDNSILSFQDATLGAALSACGWEYFTFRYGANGNCNGGCPSGLIRFVGLAETNNGPYHPNQACIDALGGVALFTMNFLVSNNRTYECQFAPIRFFWLDCGDNTISNPTGTELYLSCSVANFDNTNLNFADTTASFPTYLGAPHANCFVGFPGKGLPIRAIDFINGGIRIKCASELDARGDINLNGLSNEIADAVMFTNYFVVGMSAFGTHGAGSTAASDVNADGNALTVADLVYMIRVILGDALAYPKVAAVDVNYSVDNGIITADGNLGGAFVTVAGNVVPENLTNNMVMAFGYDEANNVTRILVYPPFANGETQTQSFTGTFLNAHGNVISIEMATAEGAPVAAKVIPTNYTLSQNYPNPFNPNTRISFALPTAGNYTLTIYNVTGQKVADYSGTAQAGTVDIDVNASSWASGIYFYKADLNNGKFVATKKMVLIK